MPRSNLAHLPQLLSPHAPEPVLNKRSHCNEKPIPCNEEQPPHPTATREKPAQQQGPAKPKTEPMQDVPGGPVVGTLLPSQGGGAWVQSPVGELRACMLHGAARKKVLMLYEAIEGWGLCGTVLGMRRS